MTETEKFKQFNTLYGLEKKELTHENALITAQLIADELQEFLQEFYPLAIIDVIPTAWHINYPVDIGNAFKELEDIRYLTGQQSSEYGCDVTSVGDEVHRSNLSKRISIFEPELALSELEHAKKRYPDAELVPHGDWFVIKCKETGKVVKPSIYSPAIITKEMYK
jgi:hypothetical protein